MKVWRDIWHSYYTVATRKNYWKQLFISASWPQRVAVVIALLVILWALLSGRLASSSSFNLYVFLIIPEAIILVVIDNVRTRTFTENFGGLPEVTAPPESEDYRRDRYVLFRDALKKKDILGSDVRSLIPLVDARLDMEQHHNELMKKFGLFASGVLTALAISWLKEISGQNIGVVIALLTLFLFVTMLALWLIPSRKARLKELKYFMMIYEKE